MRMTTQNKEQTNEKVLVLVWYVGPCSDIALGKPTKTSGVNNAKQICMIVAASPVVTMTRLFDKPSLIRCFRRVGEVGVGVKT